jgi:hypothetical protein
MNTGFAVMERTGIEPVTSGLQILSGAGQVGSLGVGMWEVRDWEPSHASRDTGGGPPDLTRI